LQTALLRIIAIPALMVILLLAGVIGLSFRLIQNEIVERQTRVVQALSRQVDQYLSETNRLLRTAAGTMVNTSTDYQQRHLRAIRQESPQIAALYLLDNIGTVLAEDTGSDSLLGMDMSGAPFFVEALRSSQPYLSDPFVSPVNGQVSVIQSVPMFNGAQFRGALAAELSLHWLQQTIEAVDRGEQTTSFIVDQRGTVVAHPRQQWVQEQLNLANLALVQAGLAGKNTFKIYYDDALDGWFLGSATVTPSEIGRAHV